MERKETELSNLVLDSSVVIKWFSTEQGTDEALALREKFLKGEIEIVVPDLQLYEIANALRYNPKLGKGEVKSCVESLIDIGIHIIVPTKDVISTAVELAFEYEITLYDAYFVALAKILKFGFVTADERLHRKLKRLDFVRILSDIR